jgi:uncharacterized protein YecE (DUF72 family)
VAERRSVAADVVGSNPTSRPNLPPQQDYFPAHEFLLCAPESYDLPRAPKFVPAAAAALAPSPHNLFAGTSGWAYPTWKPGFYPADVPAKAFLHDYASKLTSVEVNYTFRTLPTPTQLQSWLDATPPGFRFSFKAPQRITHFQRLRESEATLAEFITSLDLARQAKKLGLLLFQLPPNFAADNTRLAAFLKLPSLKNHQIAFEFRHESWFTDATYGLLRQHNAALCVAESDDLATPDIRTADFACYRLRRNGGYKPAELKAFASRFTKLAKQAETYIYFKHEDEPTGALNASTMLQLAAGSR